MLGCAMAAERIPPVIMDSKPIPDPTDRTVEAIDTEILAAREILEAKLFGAVELLKVRLDGADKVIETLRQSYNKDNFGILDAHITAIQKQIDKMPGVVDLALSGASKATEDKISSIQKQLDKVPKDVEERVTAGRETVALALAAADKTTAIAQSTADKAMAKAEAAADKLYLESQIEGLRNAVVAQIVAQKEAISAALTAAKEALTAAMTASERAIAKAEEANEKRFEAVDEFRAMLNDQLKTLVVKTELGFRLEAYEKRQDDNVQRIRTHELKMSEYMKIDSYNHDLIGWNDWRRIVDSQLTATSSKSAVIYSAVAIVIAIGGLLVAVFAAYPK